jgi:acetoin utilization deacetylase AcuC-like enzyme
MNNVGFIYDSVFLEHDTGSAHVERPERLRAIVDGLTSSGTWSRLKHATAPAAGIDVITQVHAPTYIEEIKRRCRMGERMLDDGDTVVCEKSFDIACRAAGAAIQAVDEVFAKRMHSVFCAVRPPGHHARPGRAMGFCLINNVAVAAGYAQRHHKCERVAIVDWDVHHGNGTQEVFYEDPGVLFISLHQFPLWPGTGRADEQGTGKGKGLTINCPMAPGSGDREYRKAFDQIVIPALQSFRPNLLLISAGFDAHRDDPLANINLTEDSFRFMTDAVSSVARDCGAPIVSTLEGGYNLDALARSVDAHLLGLLEA